MFDGMINISNEREKQQQTAVFSFGKRRKRYEEKSFERIIVRSMTLGVVAGCGSSSDTGSTDSASKTETKGEKTDSSSDKVTIRMSYWNSEDTVQAMLDYLAEAVPEVEIEYQLLIILTTIQLLIPSFPQAKDRTSSASHRFCIKTCKIRLSGSVG